jgi:hypothetical protein
MSLLFPLVISSESTPIWTAYRRIFKFELEPQLIRKEKINNSVDRTHWIIHGSKLNPIFVRPKWFVQDSKMYIFLMQLLLRQCNSTSKFKISPKVLAFHLTSAKTWAQSTWHTLLLTIDQIVHLSSRYICKGMSICDIIDVTFHVKSMNKHCNAANTHHMKAHR